MLDKIMKSLGYVSKKEMEYQLDMIENERDIFRDEFKRLEKEVKYLTRNTSKTQSKPVGKLVTTSESRNSSPTYVDNSINDAIIVSSITTSYDSCSSSYDSGSSHDSSSSSCE